MNLSVCIIMILIWMFERAVAVVTGDCKWSKIIDWMKEENVFNLHYIFQYLTFSKHSLFSVNFGYRTNNAIGCIMWSPMPRFGVDHTWNVRTSQWRKHFYCQNIEIITQSNKWSGSIKWPSNIWNSQWWTEMYLMAMRCGVLGTGSINRNPHNYVPRCLDGGWARARDLRDLFIFYFAHFTHDCSHMVEWLFLCAWKSKSVQCVSVSSIQFFFERNDFAFSVAFTRRQIIISINFCFCAFFFLSIRCCLRLIYYSLRNFIAHERIKNAISMLEYVESIYERGAFNITEHSVFVSGLFQSSNDCNRMKKKSQHALRTCVAI